MRNCTHLLSRLTFTAAFAGALITGSLLTGQAMAKGEFDALLAEVDFGSSAASANAVLPSEIAVTDLAATPAAEALTVPSHAEPLPSPPPATDAVPAQPVAATAAASACCNQCGTNCGKKCHLTGLRHRDFVQDGFCQPYMPPQLPNSTFYQYWRSNACNVNVWNGFQNRCHPHIDLSIHGKKSCGCGTGQCGGGHASAGDCGPIPAEWCGKPACNSCDSH